MRAEHLQVQSMNIVELWGSQSQVSEKLQAVQECILKFIYIRCPC